MDEQFPRELTPFERETLLWLLPEERAGYREYRVFVNEWKVVAKGRRGEGNYIMASAGVRVDNESPLPQILAHGSIETASGELSVSLRERFDNQIEFEIVSVRGSVNPAHVDEKRRWTLSTWLPTQICPACGQVLREVVMSSERGRTLVLALCSSDRRLWVYDEQTGVNHPIPVTNFYNELMLHKNIRDPKIALDSKRLFTDMGDFSDADFTHAFRTYNMLHTKVQFEGKIIVMGQRTGLWSKLKQILGKG